MTWLLLLGMGSKQESDIESNESRCSIPPSQETLFHMAKSYYERYGVWAGVFRLSSAEKQRIETVTAKEIVYHLRYRYVPIPNNSLFRKDTGFDQRIFYLSCEKDWQVRHMGPHMSASFPRE